MSIINSVHLRRAFGMHVSGDEMKEISKKHPNGNVNNADKNLKRDIKRITNTILSTNKPKCHEMARFLTSLKGTCYYTPIVQDSIYSYADKHGRNIKSRTINKNFNNHEELNSNANKNIGQSRQSHISMNADSAKKNHSNENEYANVLTEDARTAIRVYTGWAYKELNNMLSDNLPVDGVMSKVIDGLNEAFSKNPNFGSVLKTYTCAPHKTNLSYIKEGEVCTVHGYLSTFRNVDVAKHLKGKCGRELNVIFGRSHCDISKYSMYENEGEELYPPGVKLRKLFQYDHGDVRINIFEEAFGNSAVKFAPAPAPDVSKVN